MKTAAALLCLTGLFAGCTAFDYGITAAGGISFFDVSTQIDDLRTLFTGKDIEVTVTDLEWEQVANVTTGEMSISYETLVDGQVQDSGTIDLSDVGRELPSSVSAGVINVSGRGTKTVTVILTLDDTVTETSRDVQAFSQATSIIPLLVVLIFAVTTQMVELSLFTAIFVGACMITGNLKDGFKTTLDTYILEALADTGHGFVFLFTLFLSGLVSMLEKSGGMKGFVKDVARFATNSRSAQLVTYAVGLFVFFDDYSNTLLAGETMRPLTDMMHVSREKLAFIVDATAAPIASLTPISSWVGFELSLIEAEIERLKERFGEENLTIDTSPMAVFLQSIKYRYYPIFMIILMPVCIILHHEFGTMLLAERRCQVYKRMDGGDGRQSAKDFDDDASDEEKEASMADKPNQPDEDIPKKSFNMILPVLLLVFFIFYLLISSGDDGSGTQSVMDKIQESDSYAALLWGTMAATMITIIFYVLQPVQNGHYTKPTLGYFRYLFAGGDKASNHVRPLMTVYQCVESFLHGLGRIFPALIVLTLAWASGSVMTDVGVDRLFSSWILNGLSASSLPTLSFIISLFMALATGTSWGTMTIIFPLIMVPTYEVSGGDPTIFYATVAGVLSGAVAGDHVSPISDTTILTSLATDCKVLNHVATQAPYAIIVSIISILFGTVPIGRKAWPNIIGILLGAIAICLFIFFYCKKVIHPHGKYDLLTELINKCQRGSETELEKIKQDTINAYAEKDTNPPKSERDLELADSSSTSTPKEGYDKSMMNNVATDPAVFADDHNEVSAAEKEAAYNKDGTSKTDATAYAS